MKIKFQVMTLLLCIPLLGGCGLNPETYVKDTPVKKATSWETREPKFELSQQQISMLYNNGLPKQILKSNNGQYFTVMLPKFHSGNYGNDLNPIKSDFHYTIIPPGTYHNEDGKQEKDYIACTFDYVTRESSADYDTNVIRANLKTCMLSEEKYPSKSYKSYAEYKKAFEDGVNTLFKPTSESVTSLELTGELEPIRGTKLTDVMVVGEEDYQLPFVTYRFKLSNDDYLYLRVRIMSAVSDELLAADFLNEKCLLRDNGMSNSTKDKIVKYLSGIDYDFDSKAKEIMAGIIIGDYSSYYTTSKPSVSMNDSAAEDSVSSNTVEEFKTVETLEEKYKQLHSNNQKSSSVITNVDDVDDTEGYNDYDVTSDGGYYDE